jgi:hypothetical protein
MKAQYFFTSVVLATLGACGGDANPGGPSGLMPPPSLTVPQFPVGSYWLGLTGYDVSVVPAIPACDKPAGVPPAGKSVMIKLNVVKQGTEWVGRVAEGDGDLELRFRDAGELPFGLRSLTGTLRGQAPDGGVPGGIGPRGVSVAIEGTAAVEGQTALPFSSRVMSGRATGTLRFTDSSGGTARCPGVSLTVVTDPSVFTEGALAESADRQLQLEVIPPLVSAVHRAVAPRDRQALTVSRNGID